MPVSKRLASFKGPSTPTASPVLQPTQPVIPPPSPSRLSESTVHRRLRTLLQELRSISQTWDDIVLLDGLKAARTLVDERTELECVRIPTECLKPYLAISVICFLCFRRIAYRGPRLLVPSLLIWTRV